MANYYYNGVLLPEIPVVDGYPYVIMEKLSNRYYLVCSTRKYYFNGTNYVASGASAKNYAITFDELAAGGTWTLKSSTAYAQSGPVIWSNYDIPSGSSTASDICFFATEPVEESSPAQRMEYLQSTGEQYIDTGICVNPGYSIEVSFMVSRFTTNLDTIFGTRNGSYSRYTARFANTSAGALGIQYSNSGAGVATLYTTEYTKKSFNDAFHTLKLEANIAYIDGTMIYAFDSPTDNAQYPYNLYLFANNDAGAPGDYAHIKVACCKIWNENNELVRYFVPMCRSGVAGMWDNIEGKFYASEGTAAFFAGPLLGPAYDRKYLIRSGTTLYTITNGSLTALTETELAASLFQTYGVADLPDGSLLVGLTDPEVLYWQNDAEELPVLTLTVKGTPPLPQMFTSDPMDLTHESISGIDHATVSASEDVRFAISFDGGITWKAHDGSAWFDTSETAPGMLASTFNAITAEQWAEVVVLNSYMVRFWLPSVTAYVESVVIHYINP